jgi:ribosomal protein L27
MPSTITEATETYDHLNRALNGEVVVNIGQIGPCARKAFNQAVRAGKLVAWRGKWFPFAGAPFGIGPDKTCWSTPEVAARFADMKRGISARAEAR